MEDNKNFKHIVRISNTDVKGNIRLYHALTLISGVKYSFANAICNCVDIDKNIKVGDLDINSIKKVEDVVTNPTKHGIPSYLFNRQKDFDTGEDKHIVVASLKFTKDMDIKMMKKMKSYKGMRHSFGLPVRGQRTRSNFRHGVSLGVQRSKSKMTVAKKEGKK